MDNNINEYLISFPKIEVEKYINSNDETIQKFFYEINNSINDHYKIISIDCTNLKSINSSILARFLHIQKKYRKTGLKIKLFNLNENIKRILKNLDFGEFFILE